MEGYYLIGSSIIIFIIFGILTYQRNSILEIYKNISELYIKIDDILKTLIDNDFIISKLEKSIEDKASDVSIKTSISNLEKKLENIIEDSKASDVSIQLSISELRKELENIIEDNKSSDVSIKLSSLKERITKIENFFNNPNVVEDIQRFTPSFSNPTTGDKIEYKSINKQEILKVVNDKRNSDNGRKIQEKIMKEAEMKKKFHRNEK